jgi:hypothetical protein
VKGDCALHVRNPFMMPRLTQFEVTQRDESHLFPKSLIDGIEDGVSD